MIINKKLEELADVLMENENHPNIDKEIIVYGLACALEHGISMITIIILGLLFELTFETVVFVLAFSFIRTYAGGYHCQKAINCYLMSNGAILLVLGIIKFTLEEYMFILGGAILLISLPILLKFAPIETPNKRLDEDERKQYRNKTITHLVIECVIIFTSFLVEYYTLAFTICLGIMVSACLVFLQVLLSKL